MKFNTSFTKKMYDNHQKWLKDNTKGKRLNLSYVNLRGTDLARLDLAFADLSYADLRDTNLDHTSLLQADLTGADLRGANLTMVKLTQAVLTNANITDIDIDLDGAIGGYISTNKTEADTDKSTDVDVSSVANLILNKVNDKLATKGLTIESLAILMDTVQVANDVLTTSNYELGTLDVPDPEEVKKRLQEAGGAIIDGGDNSVLGSL